MPANPQVPWALGKTVVAVLALVASSSRGESADARSAADTPGTGPLRISVYATAGDVMRFLVTPEGRERAFERLGPLGVSRVFLEGRRGDEYVAPGVLREVRESFARRGIRCSGGIATVPGAGFATRQTGALGWLNWESPRTRQEVAGFFRENAPVFDELIVDDFFCTGDVSPASEEARAGRPWSEYRRDLLVSLIGPLMVEPTRAADPGTRLILKFPQWYDRFHLFGYDPPRMAAPFDEIWVGTEVRNPQTRRMGYVQPTEGYINFRWIRSVAGPKVVGAWFDHIECTPQNFIDQAFQSVLAGAQELTLFRLGDVMEGHPGDALLASRLPELRALAGHVREGAPRGVPFYKPAGSDAGENLYLMDYLAMLGWPVLPVAEYPVGARVAFFGAQAAADAGIVARLETDVGKGLHAVVTPAFLRRCGGEMAAMAGVSVAATDAPAQATRIRVDGSEVALTEALDLDGSLRATAARVPLTALVEDRPVPFLASHRLGRGRITLINVRTFSEQDFAEAGEWLLAPRPLGLSTLPASVAEVLRRRGAGLRFQAPAGVALYQFAGGACLYNFRAEAVEVRLDGRRFRLGAHQWVWRDSVGRR